MSSEDLDVFGPATAADTLAKHLEDSLVRKTAIDDASPNSAVVTGRLAGKNIQVDFLRAIKGVDTTALSETAVTLEDSTSKIRLLHPLDCMRSRFSNINDLHRNDTHSISSAKASILIVQAFIDELLENGEIRKAQSAIHDVEYIIRDHFLGKSVEALRQFDPMSILLRFRLDKRLDSRWRSHQLRSAIERLGRKVASLRARGA